jgi:O-antigen/teichoic acid export membrane protein
LTKKQEPDRTLSGAVFKGAIWLLVSFALSKLGRLATTFAVAALLTPQAYGIVTLSMVFIVLGAIIVEFGIWQAVVQRPNPDERYLSTAFTANIPISFVMTMGVFLAAPWIAYAYAEPKLSLMLRIMACTFVLEGIAYVPDGLLRKQLAFRERVLPEVSGTFALATVTITLLYLGGGVVSYAVGFVIESAVRCSLTIATAVKKIKWRPKLRVYQAEVKEIFNYGKHILGFELITYTSSIIDYLIVGRVLGSGSLGFYALAFNLANYTVTNLSLILSRVMFPAFSILQENVRRARRAYLQTVRLLAMVTVPVLTMIAILAAPLVTEILGAEWQPAVFPLQAMVIAGISRTISVPSSDILRAVGLPHVPKKIAIVEGCVLLGALLLVVNQGLAAVALTVAVVMSLASWASIGAACRILGVGIRELSAHLMPSLALAASGAGTVFTLRLLDLNFLSDIVELVFLLTAAGVAMMVCLTTVCRRLLRDIVALAASLRSR